MGERERGGKNEEEEGKRERKRDEMKEGKYHGLNYPWSLERDGQR